MTGYGALFDLDGTLIDTPRAIVETFTATLADIGAQPCAAGAIRATIGLPLERAFGTLLRVSPEHAQVTLGIERYQVFFREKVLPAAEDLIFPGVVDGLRTLRGQGVLLAVATSKFQRSAQALLTAAGLWDHFDLVVGADDVTHPKPDPEMAQLILRSLRLAADRAVMVGDTTHDLLMARAAGIRSIAVRYGVHGAQELASADPTWTVDSFPEVVELVLVGALEVGGKGGAR